MRGHSDRSGAGDHGAALGDALAPHGSSQRAVRETTSQGHPRAHFGRRAHLLGSHSLKKWRSGLRSLDPSTSSHMRRSCPEDLPSVDATHLIRSVRRVAAMPYARRNERGTYLGSPGAGAEEGQPLRWRHCSSAARGEPSGSQRSRERRARIRHGCRAHAARRKRQMGEEVGSLSALRGWHLARELLRDLAGWRNGGDSPMCVFFCE